MTNSAGRGGRIPSRVAMLALSAAVLASGCVSVLTPPSTSPARPSPPDATATASAAPTPPPPTASPGPTATPAPTLPSSSPEPTTGAPTVEPSTGVESAPPAGDLIFSDDFSGTTKYLSVGSQEGFGGGDYVDGVYRITAEPRDGFVNYTAGGSTEGCEGSDCSFPEVINNQILTSSVEVDATLTGGSTAGSFGIACAYQGTGTIGFFIGLTISADGRRYAIAQNSAPGDTPFDALKGGADRGEPETSINQGTGAVNHLRADCGTQSFALYVNDHLMTTGRLDEPLKPPAYQRGIALIAAPATDEGVTVDFDNLVVSTFEGGEPPVTPEFGLTIHSNPMTVDDGSWPTGEFTNADAIFTNAYTITVDQPDTIAPIVPLVGMLPPDRVSVGVTVNHLAGSAGQGAGPLCRVTTDGMYSFRIDMQGRFSIFKTDMDGSTPLVDWTESDAIDPSAANVLEFRCVDDSLSGSINGTQVATVNDSTFPTGQYGLWADSPADLGDVPTTVQFTDFIVSHP